MDKKKIIVIIAFAAIVLVSAYLWWKRRQQMQTATDVLPPISDVAPATAIKQQPQQKQQSTLQRTFNPTIVGTWPLVHGSRGKEVKQLQAYLLAKYGLQFPSGIDGVWGDETSKNVKKALNLGGIAESTFKNLGIDKIKV